MANMEMIHQTLDWIENHQRNWEQTSYVEEHYKDADENEVDVCNSTFCFAGTALLLANRVKVVGRYLYPTNQDGNVDFSAHWERRARELLDLNEDQANAIFYAMTHNFAKFKEHVLWVVDHSDPEFVEEMYDRKANVAFYQG